MSPDNAIDNFFKWHPCFLITGDLDVHSKGNAVPIQIITDRCVQIGILDRSKFLLVLKKIPFASESFNETCFSPCRARLVIYYHGVSEYFSCRILRINDGDPDIPACRRSR